MSPFTTKMNRSNPRETLLVLLLPLAILGVVVLLYFRDNPNSTFKRYQRALVEKDWATAVGLSDENTRAYLASLDQWVWSGNLKDIESLDSFQQFLILTTRCRVLGDESARPEEAGLFGIWMEALQLNRVVVRSKIINRYNFGEISIGQLFLKQTHADTGLQIRFSNNSQWKIESMALLKEAYDQASAEGTRQLLRTGNPNYFGNGFSSQHLMPLRFHFEPKMK